MMWKLGYLRLLKHLILATTCVVSISCSSPSPADLQQEPKASRPSLSFEYPLGFFWNPDYYDATRSAAFVASSSALYRRRPFFRENSCGEARHSFRTRKKNSISTTRTIMQHFHQGISSSSTRNYMQSSPVIENKKDAAVVAEEWKERENGSHNTPFVENTTTCCTIEGLLDKVKSYCPTACDQKLITRAYLFAKENVSELCKNCPNEKSSGSCDESRYLRNAIGVAYIIADMKLDADCVATGLLHGILKECSSYDDSSTLHNHHKLLEKEFGTGIARMIRGLNKVDEIHFQTNNTRLQEEEKKRQAENYRKMIVATAKDVRVVLVKLADRAQRARSLWELAPSSPETQRNVALEMLELYAPLAHRLGIYRLKTELEDTSLRYLRPAIYTEIQQNLASLQEKQQSFTDGVIAVLQSQMSENAALADVSVTGRVKSCYSIYQKMQSKKVSFDEIPDIMAFRVLVDDVGQCYQALGIVHAKWRTVPGRLKDYIARPKSNGYQSLHTTVVGPGGYPVEVQIRTGKMHHIAESGVAAHWQYKARGETKSFEETQRRFTWLRELVDRVQHLNDAEEFNHRRDDNDEDLFEKEVFVFSPGGDLFDLPTGSSIVDFAYRIHSDLGNRCGGGKVNGKMKPLKYKLRNGDAIEIIVSSNQTPHRQWLGFVRTAKAKKRIREWLRQQQQQQDEEHVSSSSSSVVPKKTTTKKDNNKPLLEDGLVLETTTTTGSFSQQHHNPTTTTTTKNDGIVVGGSRSMLYSFCKNCNPLYGEDVKGIVTQGRGITVHRLDCKYVLESDQNRRIDVVWDDTSVKKPKARSVLVEVVFESDEAGVLARMSKAISSLGIRIGNAVLTKHDCVRFDLALSTIDELNKAIVRLQQEQGVLRVIRR